MQKYFFFSYLREVFFFPLKGQCHEMVYQLRPLVYSIGLNITPRNSFKLVKSRIKNIRRFKQGASLCKIAGDGFDCFAKIRAQIHNAVLAYCGVFQADCHRENCRTADCYNPRT
jgi:hypothetical protein